MNKLLFFLMLAPLVLSAQVATLCPKDLQNETAVLYGDQPQYVSDAQTNIYKICWVNYEFPDSDSHTNTTVDAFESIDLPALGKSVSVSGIDDYPAWLEASGFVRCDEDGQTDEAEDNLTE